MVKNPEPCIYDIFNYIGEQGEKGKFIQLKKADQAGVPWPGIAIFISGFSADFI